MNEKIENPKYKLVTNLFFKGQPYCIFNSFFNSNKEREKYQKEWTETLLNAMKKKEIVNIGSNIGVDGNELYYFIISIPEINYE